VRIGIEAPPELAVVREELAEELKRAEQALASGHPESIAE
jgi:sRNA-binding carbon storage regulator CsrA